MTSDFSVCSVLSNYTALPYVVQANRRNRGGGFSGSEIWLVEAENRRYCLRRWPAEHPDRQRLTFIHQVLREATAQGLDFVPAPLQNKEGTTFTEHEGRFWELSPWVPGQADYWRNPSPQRLEAAFRALARFHAATRHVASAEPLVGFAPALVERKRGFTQLFAGEFQDLLAAASRSPSGSQLDSLFNDTLQLAPQIARRLVEPLETACLRPVPLQPAIRDVWHDHVLFTGDEVTGLVDFGALRIDTPLTDLARLIGSLVEDDAQQRQSALDAYSALRPLSEADRWLIDLLDHSSVVLSLANWARWLYLERREFADFAAVENRITKLAARLRRWL